MSFDNGFTKQNLDLYLRELAKEFRKRAGKSMPAEIILIGGAAVVINYGFRKMTYDMSDVIGVLWEQENKGSPITISMIKDAAINLYGSYESLPDLSRNYIEKAIEQGNYEAVYQRVRQTEADNKDLLLQFQEEYPGVTTTDNVNDILAAIRMRKEGK